MTRLAVMASHGGSILQAIMDACDSGQLAATVALVISNNSTSKALQRARAADIATAHISSTTHEDDAERDQAILQALQTANTDWLVLAGYMKKLGSKTLTGYAGRILNTHPALLPKYGGAGFYGRKVHAAVLANRDSRSGATVHLVDGDYDTGPILAQAEVSVHESDTVATLEERVKTVERKLIVDTLADLVRRAP